MVWTEAPASAKAAGNRDSPIPTATAPVVDSTEYSVDRLTMLKIFIPLAVIFAVLPAVRFAYPDSRLFWHPLRAHASSSIVPLCFRSRARAAGTSPARSLGILVQYPG
jgi:hypothetical protein